MKRIVMTLALLFAGCNGRLDVTPEILDACPGVPVETIETLITWAESDRLAGWTRHEEILIAIQSCGVEVVCANCTTRIIGQVYSDWP